MTHNEPNHHRTPVTPWRRRLLPLLPVLLTLLAFAVRVWQLDALPASYSDDELSDIFVISQKIFQGDYSVYYVDATGQEALYFVIAGSMLRLLGYNALGIRLLSALLGTLTIPLIYQMGRALFGRLAGLTAAAMLAVSFWSLIYSRIDLRHIALPVVVLLTFYTFWRGLKGASLASAYEDGSEAQSGGGHYSFFLLSGIAMGVGFYTYFAARGVPLILLAFIIYLALFQRPLLRARWRGFLLTFGLAALLSVPLLLTLSSQEGADARVTEVAVPLVEARAGNLEPLREHVTRTLSMFHSDGDDEFLYNIPGRPVFGVAGAIFFWSGVLIAVVYGGRPAARALTSRFSRKRGQWLQDKAGAARGVELASAFLFLWWLAGISPAFLSVPPASLSHTLLAQAPAYLLASLPIVFLGRKLAARWRPLVVALAVLLPLLIAARDLPDYFVTWPQRGNMRFLYHADLSDVADYLAAEPELVDFAITGLLSGPWDRLALELELQEKGVAEVLPRWYNPQRAIITAVNGERAVAFQGYPKVETVYDELYQPIEGATAGGYQLAEVAGSAAVAPAAPTPTCFENGLCLIGSRYDEATGRLHLRWQAARPLTLPPMPIISKPPPPNTYDGPRLLVFAQLLDSNGQLLLGDDGLWVDPSTLLAGDNFMQQHVLQMQEAASSLIVGLYDPLTGERIATEGGATQVELPLP